MKPTTRLGCIGLIGALLGVTACASRTPQQVRIAVAEESFEQQRAFACAEVCEAEQASEAATSLLDCMRECPGVEVAETDTCTEGDPHAICSDTIDATGTLSIDDGNRAAEKAMGMLRELAHPSLRAVAEGPSR